jgi:hypothetical protein
MIHATLLFFDFMLNLLVANKYSIAVVKIVEPPIDKQAVRTDKPKYSNKNIDENL